MQPILDIFKTYFEIHIANTSQQLEKIFRLRYDVFCTEFQFEKEEDCPNALEQDLYDPFSIEALLYHPNDGKIAGCVRLILPVNTCPPLPVENFCHQGLCPEQKNAYAEVSRLTIAKDFRRRLWDGHLPSGVSDNPAQIGVIGRNFPLPAVSMMFTGASLCRLLLLDYVYAMMEPKLAHAMTAYGIEFQQIGDVHDYHGQRAPYRLDPLLIWETVQPELYPLLNFIYFKVSQREAIPVSAQYKKIQTG
ncbi:MAG TPA: PEP-CTERM/exosortase system-associated acyltransferase [Gammaproteobacteria bacterium]|nr:PEP-CTERM/exosortase system-associated acyltransferase [Gammaproteobacteria bacterium]